jgi:hypothetical protein
MQQVAQISLDCGGNTLEMLCEGIFPPHCTYFAEVEASRIKNRDSSCHHDWKWAKTKDPTRPGFMKELFSHARQNTVRNSKYPDFFQVIKVRHF